MKNAIKSPGGRVLAFDTESRSFEISGAGISKVFSLGTFLRFSETKPWSVPAREYEKVRLAVTPGDETMLVVAAEDDEMLCGMAFNFDGELLKGDLLVSFKKDSCKNFVALAIPVDGESKYT